MRSTSIETEVQLRLDNGDNVWVIGDVHGHFATFKKLIENVELSGNDCIVMLGDLIDRGPSSAAVVRCVRQAENMYCVRGNHEQMMINGFDEYSFFKKIDTAAQVWLRTGGKNTEHSYTSLYEDRRSALDAGMQDVEWMKTLPTEIVLNKWRLVHGGYDPSVDVEGQSESTHMTIRSQFFDSKEAIDEDRTILFGHSVTFSMLHRDKLKAGTIWQSDVKTKDGKPMAIGIDTCVYHTLDLPKVLTAFNIQTSEVVYQSTGEK
jgi:serine/threonine protein phosphatase 1